MRMWIRNGWLDDDIKMIRIGEFNGMMGPYGGFSVLLFLISKRKEHFYHSTDDGLKTGPSTIIWENLPGTPSQSAFSFVFIF